MIKRLVRKIFWWAITPQAIEAAINRQKNLANRAKVTIDGSSSLYEQARVFNFQNDISKIVVGAGSHIRGELLIFANGGSITIGNNCYVGEGSRIWSASKIEIGNDVLISHNVNIIDSDSHELDYQERASSFKELVSKGHPKEKGSVKTAPILVEDHAWISYNVSILKGVHIGRGSIVAAGSVVTKDVKAFTIVAGNPAREIKSIYNG